MVKHWGHLSDQTHWVLFGMAKLAGLIPGATCLVLYLSILHLISFQLAWLALAIVSVVSLV